MKVHWNNVPGYEGKYQISNTGKVRGRFGELKPQKSWDGYLYVKLCDGAIQKRIKIHRLVALAFIPNPQNFPEINHKDEIKTNNCVDNLEWCNRRYNNNYGNRNLLAGNAISKANRRMVYCYKNGIMVGAYESVKTAGEMLNIDPTAISRCALNKRKSAGGFNWSYTAKGKPE